MTQSSVVDSPDVKANDADRHKLGAVSFRDAFLFWLKLGFISFGGPAGQISIMYHELVERRRWISEKRFLHALNYCMLLPGPEAQQLATYIGWLMHRTWGGIVAGGLFILPSLLILIFLSWIYVVFGNVPFIAGLFYGVKPAVTAIVVLAAYRVGSRSLQNMVLWILALCSFIAIFAFKIPFPFIIIAAALIGAIGGYILPDKFKIGGGHHKAKNIASKPALIDNDTPPPAHALFRWSKLLLLMVIGAFLWITPMGLLTATYGWDHTFTQMGWFFTKAALLTFGGAYAVLPYVYQGAVEQYGWLNPAQMIDGLALGETTPGPLIMVVAFVGFVGGYLKSLFGVDYSFLSGAVAASLVTWFTFLPSFLFIFMGAPLVEKTRDKLKFTAPLTAITAAIVGVILNLALFFAYHVLWPHGFAGNFVKNIDWVSLLIMLAAGMALFYFKRNIMQVIGGAAIIGLVIKVMGIGAS